jgi:hypothetical protein
MADPVGLDQAWRRALEANARYYEALGQVTADYLRTLMGVLGELRLPARFGLREAPPAAPAPPPAPPAAMVLEAAAGQAAAGAFMVQNRLTQKVAAPVVASAFLDPSGHEARPLLAFEPDVVALEPGEQMLVRVTARIDDRLESGVAYRGEVTIPGLSGDRVQLVLRRRASANGRDGAAAPRGRRKSRPRRAARAR